MKNKILKVYIASPRDMVVERKILREVISGLNEGVLMKRLGLAFEVSTWEDVFSPTEQSQEIINRLINECDLLFGIFYKRYDALSGSKESKSLEEFLSAYDLWKTLKKPHIMFYFEEVKFSSLKDVEASGLDKVYRLKGKIEKAKILFVDEFSAPYEFCEKIYNSLEQWIRETVNKNGRLGPAQQ